MKLSVKSVLSRCDFTQATSTTRAVLTPWLKHSQLISNWSVDSLLIWKLVSWLTINLTIQPPMYISFLHCVTHEIYIDLADLRCGGALGGFTSHWISSLHQTETNSADALELQLSETLLPNIKPNGFYASLINVWYIYFTDYETS